MALVMLAVGPTARGGITISIAEVQPVEDPHFNLFLNFVIGPNTTVNLGDYVHIDAIPYIGTGGSNLVKEPSPSFPLFINLFDTVTSPFFGSFIFATNPHDTSLDIIYTGFYNKDIHNFPTSIVTGPNQELVVPFDTVGVQTIDFPASVTNTPAFQAELTAPLTYTSSTGGVTTTGTVTPVLVPEPATIVMVLSSLPVALLAYRHLRSRRALGASVR
jgi:hypothetical protein